MVQSPNLYFYRNANSITFHEAPQKKMLEQLPEALSDVAMETMAAGEIDKSNNVVTHWKRSEKGDNRVQYVLTCVDTKFIGDNV